MFAGKVTLYDYASTLPSQRLLPFPTRTRLLLNIKKIPFETKFIAFKDVESTAKAVGALPTEKLTDGRPRYTVPFLIIEEPGKDKFVLSDSTKIAHYFDERVPEPPVFPEQTAVVESIAMQYLVERTIAKLMPIFLIHAVAAFDEEAAKWFMDTRILVDGVDFEKMVPQNTEEMVQAKKDMYAAFDALAVHLDRAGEGNYRITPHISYAEVPLLAHLHTFRAVSENSKAGPEYADDWKTFVAANGGRWVKLLSVPEYSRTDSVYLQK